MLGSRLLSRHTSSSRGHDDVDGAFAVDAGREGVVGLPPDLVALQSLEFVGLAGEEPVLAVPVQRGRDPVGLGAEVEGGGDGVVRLGRRVRAGELHGRRVVELDERVLEARWRRVHRRETQPALHVVPLVGAREHEGLGVLLVADLPQVHRVVGVNELGRVHLVQVDGPFGRNRQPELAARLLWGRVAHLHGAGTGSGGQDSQGCDGGGLEVHLWFGDGTKLCT